jgi:hypothetical protein
MVKEATPCEKHEARLAVKPSPRILHSSPAEEKKLGFPFSKNGPSTIQGEGAMSPFSDLREWEERGVTTPNTTPTNNYLHFTKKLERNLAKTKPKTLDTFHHHNTSLYATSPKMNATRKTI